MNDFGALLLRLTLGGFLFGHGSQKLLGWFKGPGLKGTSGFMEMLNLKPGDRWALAASASEFGGGALTALGLLGPVGPLTTIGAMGVATGTVHWGKPIWVSEGGAELPLTNAAIALALALNGPGAYSLDRLFGIRTPRALTAATLVAVAGGVAYALTSRQTPPAPAEDQAQDKLQGGTEAGAH